VKGGFVCSAALQQKMLQYFQGCYARRDASFGNARLARNAFESILRRQASRILKSEGVGRDILQRLEAEDWDHNDESERQKI
jgi:hypothetical protein